MGRSKKRSASKVAAAAPASSPAQPLKKGKREAEVVIENELISAKKQKASEKKSEIKPETKKDEKRVESEQKPDAEAPGKPDSDTSGVTEDAPTPVPAKNVADPSNGRSEEEPAKKEETEEDLKEKAKSSPADEAAPKANDTDATPKEQSTVGGGSKTIFVKNMPFTVLLGDVVEFFRPVGGVADVRLARSREDDSFKGYGHVEFATAEQAEKALLELDGKKMLNRPVKLEVAREEKKVEEQKQSFKRKPKLAVFVTGFDAFAGETKIRSKLMAHFASCGKITRVSIPSGPSKVPYGPRKRPTGVAFVQFMNENARSKALELGNEELVVGEARPTADSDSGGFGSGGGRRRGLGAAGRGLNNGPSKGKPLTGANATTVGGN